MAQPRPIRAGILGLGKMGRLRACELARRRDAQIVCAYDPDPAGFQARWPEVPCLAAPEDVLAAEVDVVFVCVPNRYIPDLTIAALGAGKHVFCEKPPGRTVRDIVRIREAEAEHPGCRLAFGFNHRFHAGIQEAYRIATSGRLGEILWIRGVYGKAGGPGFEREWRNDGAISGGGILLDQGIHMLDLFRMFLGEITEVKSMVADTFWKTGVEDNAFALLRDARGRIAQIHSSSTQWKHRFTFEIYLTRGALSVDGILTSSRTYGDETLTVVRRAPDGAGLPVEETLYFDEDPSWAAEIDAFFRCIRDGRPVESGSSVQALRAMELVFAIYAGDPTFKGATAAPPEE